MKLLILALAPVFIIAVYVYFRDKYEKEPLSMLIKALLAGAFIVLPVLLVGQFLKVPMAWIPESAHPFYTAFVLASLNEEMFKFAALILLVWRSQHFNEKFDGIVYAVFISLGFAAVENIMYVFQHGEMTGLMRAVVSVPGHALFGVTMGYYLGLAKFYSKQSKPLLLRSFFYPIVLHGVFDFILMQGNYRLLGIFIPFVIFLYIDGLRKMKLLSSKSIYRS